MKLIEVIVYIVLLLIISAGIAQSYTVMRPVLASAQHYRESYTSLHYIYKDFKTKTRQGQLKSDTAREEWEQKLMSQFKLSNTALSIKKAQNSENAYVFLYSFMLSGKQYEVLSVYEGGL